MPGVFRNNLKCILSFKPKILLVNQYVLGD